MCTFQSKIFKTTLFVLITIFLISGCSDKSSGPAGEWVWSPLNYGVNDRVFAMIEYDGKLIVGGYFDTVANVLHANNIAAWNDTSWSALGTGMNGEVAALTVYNGQLIAGGTFTTAGGVSANYIAAWDGETWMPLSTGMNGRVRALGIYTYPEGHTYEGNSLLIAGGEFTQAGSNNLVRNLAAWDGTSWGWPSVNTDGGVHAIGETADGPLYIGGDFAEAGNSTCNSIFFYNESAAGLGSGMKYQDERGSVFSILIDDNNIYAGGIFDSASGVPVKYVAVFNATIGWRACGDGLRRNGGTGDVRALTVFNNKIIAGGYFNYSGDTQVNYIASWDGSSWSPLGDGVNGDYWPHVWAMAIYNDKLFVGGRFTTAGEVDASNIAVWHFVAD